MPHAGSDPCSITQSGAVAWIAECGAARVAWYDGRHRGEYPTRAPLEHITVGTDGWTYAIDANGDLEMIDPKGKVTVIPQPAPGMTPLAIAPGIDGDVWILASNVGAASLVQVLY